MFVFSELLRESGVLVGIKKTLRAYSVLRETRPGTVPARNAYIICIGQPSPGTVPGRNDPKRTNAKSMRHSGVLSARLTRSCWPSDVEPSTETSGQGHQFVVCFLNYRRTHDRCMWQL